VSQANHPHISFAITYNHCRFLWRRTSILTSFILFFFCSPFQQNQQQQKGQLRLSSSHQLQQAAIFSTLSITMVLSAPKKEDISKTYFNVSQEDNRSLNCFVRDHKQQQKKRKTKNLFSLPSCNLSPRSSSSPIEASIITSGLEITDPTQCQ
jgi:hypothetical protein